MRLLRCCAQMRAPLVLFLDDLQWADSPSLRFLEALTRDGAGAPLLLIGAYRSADADERHALTCLVAGLAQQEAVRVEKIELGPLPLADTQVRMHCGYARSCRYVPKRCQIKKTTHCFSSPVCSLRPVRQSTSFDYRSG